MAATVNHVAATADGVAVTGHPDTALLPAAGDRTAVLAAAVAEVQARYASWTVGNLIAAIDRQLGDLNTSAAARPALLGVGAALRGREWGLVPPSAPPTC
jgi:hypothetical protein